MSVWKTDAPYLVLEAKGKKVPVGTTKVYVAKDKKYGGEEKYHVYQKTDEPGKKSWKYIGTVGAKSGTADAHLKDLGVEVQDGKPVGFDKSKGKSMMIPPPEESSKQDSEPEDDYVPDMGAEVEPDESGDEWEGLPDAGTITKEEQEEWTMAMQGTFDFIKDVKEELASTDFMAGSFEKLKKKYPWITKEAGGDSVMGAFEFADSIMKAYMEASGGDWASSDALSVFKEWLKTHKGKSEEDMATLFGENWSKLAWGMAADISKSLGGLGDEEFDYGDEDPDLSDQDPDYADDADEEPPLTTPEAFKVIQSGKGKKVPEGTTKIQPEKNGKLQVHQKKDGKWQYLGTVGAKKGKNKGAAEAHLKTLGIETDGESITNLDVSGSAVAVVPADGAKPKKDAGEGKLLDPNYVPAGGTPEGDAKQAAYDAKYSSQGMSLAQFKKKIKDSGDPIASDMLDMVGQSFGFLEKAKEGMIDAAALAGSQYIAGSKSYDWNAIKSTFGDDWAYKSLAVAKGAAQAFHNQEKLKQAASDIAKAMDEPDKPEEKKVEYPVPSAAVKSEFKGIAELADIVADSGGITGVSKEAQEIFDEHSPGWKTKVTAFNFIGTTAEASEKNIAAAIANPSATSGIGNLLKDNIVEKMVELHTQKFGAPPGETPKKKKKDVGDPIPAEPKPVATPEPPQATPVANVEEPKKKKKKKDQGDAIPMDKKASDYTEPAPGTAAWDLEVPPNSQLKLKGSANQLGGAGDKQMYVDSAGNEYLFKVAASKSGNKAQPFRAHVQAGFSKVATKVKDIHPDIEVRELGGKVGAIYPFLPAADKVDLSGQSPSSLTAQEKLDVAEEHVLDWMMSQHDSHSKNFLRLPNGRIIGVDKEQGFKYFGDDELSTDYHPNSKYGEQEPYYNKFWREFAQGKNDFDPTKLKGAIDKAMSISGTSIRDALSGYVKEQFPGDAVAQYNFEQKVINRKNTLKRDFEKFISGLYEKREGQEGAFTFDAGWVATADKDKPYTKVKVTPAYTTPAVTKGPEDRLKEIGGKTVPHKTDPTKITVKATGDEASLKKVLEDLGFGDAKIKVGGYYKMAFVDKAKWDALPKEVVTPEVFHPEKKEEIVVYPEKGVKPDSGEADYLPAISPHKKAESNVSELKSVKPSDNIGWLGKRISLDGPLVEGQVARLARKQDEKGTFYEVSFKLRPEAAKKVSGGSSDKYYFTTGKYDDKKDAVVKNDTAIWTKGTRWQSGEDDIHLADGTGGGGTYSPADSHWALKNRVTARIRGEGEVDVKKRLTELVNKMAAGMGKEVVRDTTEKDEEVANLAAVLSAYSPKTKITPGAAKNPDKLRKAIKENTNLTDDQINKAAKVETLPGFSSTVIPGRWRSLGGTGDEEDPVVRYAYWGASTPSRVVSMFKGGSLLGVNERANAGLPAFGASDGEDMHQGGADQITTRLAVKGQDYMSLSDSNNVTGTFNLIIAPDELDRLDTTLNLGDGFGATNPKTAKGKKYWTNRDDLSTQVSQLNSYPTMSSPEMVFRRGVATSKVLRVSAGSETNRKKLIDAFREEGIEEVNGVPIEDFVVTSTSRGELYKKYVKPAGY